MIGLQIANEVNLTLSPDSSDGGPIAGRGALVEGVIAARDEVRRRGPRHLEDRLQLVLAARPRGRAGGFWRELRDGARFARSVDWLGLDVYPGTVFPPSLGLGGAPEAIVGALAASLRCFAGRIGIGRRVPIKVEEKRLAHVTAGPARPRPRLLESMVRAVHRRRATFGVTDYRWFNLRDADTSSPALFQHFGLLESDYDSKPAFRSYRRLSNGTLGGGEGGRRHGLGRARTDRADHRRRAGHRGGVGSPPRRAGRSLSLWWASSPRSCSASPRSAARTPRPSRPT